MADKGDNNDPLFSKLDNLMQSAHARKPHDPPPLLTDAVPAPDDSAIPTLTDAVEPPQPNVKPEPAGDHPPQDHGDDPTKLVSSRLVAAIDREMEQFAKELPSHRATLAVLHRSLRFALPELVRLRWEDLAEQERGVEYDADADPDQ